MGHENGGWMNDDQRDATKDAARQVEPPDCAFASPEDPRWDTLRAMTPAQASQDSPGPQTHEEARQFHEGFLAGATAYCAAIGHSCLKSDNPKLREVFDVQGWKTIETFEKMPKPDWRIGLNCKPKYRTHPLFNCAHNCVIIGTRASSIHKDGLLLIAVDDGRQLLQPADDWMTASQRGEPDEQPEGMPGTFMPPPRSEHVDEALRLRCEANTRRILDEAIERSKGSDTWVPPSDNAAKPLTCANCGEVSTNPGQFTPDGLWLCTEACRKELCDKQSYGDLAASGGIVDAP